MRIRSQADGEPIAAALAVLPTAIRRQVAHVQFVAGIDPVFAGLHGFGNASHGRSYRDIAHCVFPCHLAHRPRDQRVTTIVIPRPEAPVVVLHEIGHALHEAIGDAAPIPSPVTRYAATNDHEAFAEAFTAALAPPDWLGRAYDGWRDALDGGPFLPFMRTLLR